MKRKIFFMLPMLAAAAAFLTPNRCHAQWSAQVTGTTVRLEEIFFAAPDTGYAVGDSGVLLATVNGGASWSQQTTGTGMRLNDVYFLDSQSGFVSADSGIVLKTLDGGTTWAKLAIPHPNPVDLYSVYFIDAQTGFAGGSENTTKGIIFKTTNGGLSWSVVNTPVSTQDIGYRRLAFPDAQTGYALTRGMCMKSTDGGNNWFVTDSALVQSGGMFSILEDCHFFSPDTGFIVGWYNPFTGYTVNGGGQWTDLAPGNGQWYAVEFPDPQTGYLAGWGQLMKSADGGATWSDITTPLIQNNGIYSMYFTDVTTGYACGAGGVILKTTTGATGTGILEPAPVNLVVFPNPSAGTVELRLEWHKEEEAVLSVFDTMGGLHLKKEVRLRAGFNSFGFLADHGFYVVRLTTAAETRSRRLTIR